MNVLLLDSCCSPQLMAEGAPLDAFLLLSAGFVISLGHCVGMCGPLLGAYSAAQRQEGESAWRLLPALLVYHLGRIGSYALIGLALGLVGTAARLGGDGRLVQGIVSLLVGLLMGLLGLGLMDWLPTRRWAEASPFGQGLYRRVAGLLARRHAGGRFLMGMANGFLPCGPVYAVALGSLVAASPILGAGAMLLYGMGTLPVLLALGLGAGRLAPQLSGRLFKLGAALVLLIGLQLVLRGAAALGWIGHLRFGEFVIW